MSSEVVRKCAHETCNCVPPVGQKYCSTICADSKNLTTLKCCCEHPGCKSQSL